jgi:hypothetical protein
MTVLCLECSWCGDRRDDLEVTRTESGLLVTCGTCRRARESTPLMGAICPLERESMALKKGEG